MKFDFMQYLADEHLKSTSKYTGFLFTEFALDQLEENDSAPYRLAGGGLFRWQEWEDHEPLWELDWIWVHPFFRHRGVLSKHWEKFTHQFGNFDVALPLSNDMEKFLATRT